MKITSLSLLLGSLFLFSESSLAVGPRTLETPISVQNFRIKLNLNEQSVLCSTFDYQAPVLKVLVPELDKITLLNHENQGAGTPCLGSVRCSGIDTAEQFLRKGPADEVINLEVRRSRINSENLSEKVCNVVLKETLKTQIHGMPFFHERRTQLPNRRLEDCLK